MKANESDFRKVRRGRLSAAFYHHNRHQTVLRAIAEHSPRFDLISKLWPGNLERKRNVHFIILESFFNPEWLSNVSYSQPPLHPDMRQWLRGKRKYSHAISPVYGGGSVQTAFELLTGTPALELFAGPEFHSLDGHILPTLASKLRQEGYVCFASLGYPSTAYDSRLAYQSLGFTKSFFIDDPGAYFRTAEYGYFIFDGDMFQANLKYLQENIGRQPLFNFVFGAYGHSPFYRNKPRGPDVIDVGEEHPELHEISNQYYYRTEALASYLEKLKAIDPDGIVLVLGDHLPPLPVQRLTFQFDVKTTSGLLFDGWKEVDFSGQRFYRLPYLVWDLLREVPAPSTGQRSFDDAQYQQLYLSLIGVGQGRFELPPFPALEASH